MIRTLSAIALATALLTGCSGLPAQNLDLHPSISVSQKLPPSTVIAVRAEDTRKSALIGQRIDRLKNTAPLSLIDGQEQLEHAAEHALEDMGIRDFRTGGFVMTLYLDELNYKAQQKNLLQEIAADTKIRVKIEKNGQFYSGTYRTETTKQFVNTPTPADNEELFNKLVSDTLNRAFSDNKLLDFIRVRQNQS